MVDTDIDLESLIGKTVMLHAIGGNANTAFHRSFGVVGAYIGDNIIAVVMDKKSFGNGNNMRFRIGPNDFGVEILAGDWDE